MRDTRLELTVTEAERALLREAAERDGLSLATWMRRHLLEVARTRAEELARADAIRERRATLKGN